MAELVGTRDNRVGAHIMILVFNFDNNSYGWGSNHNDFSENTKSKKYSQWESENDQQS